MVKKTYFKNDKVFYVLLSLLFVLTVQIFDVYKGNAAHLIHSIKHFDDNKLQNDWIANQEHHLPLFTYFNYIVIKLFSSKVVYIVHSLLLGICTLSLFLISKNLFPKLSNRNLYILWFATYIVLFHENSFFTGVAGQKVIDAGYQPASFGIFIFLGIYFFLKNQNLLTVFFICLAASFHPTYVLHSGFLVAGILISNLIFKNYKDFLKVLFFYICLILPITTFVMINFMMIDKELAIIGQKIMFNRIPHHADIHYWFSYKDIIFLLIYFTSLYIIRKNQRFFILFFIFGFSSILLSSAQFFLNSESLALTFPWRSSVFIAPISSLIIISYLIVRLRMDMTKVSVFIYGFLIISTIFFGLKSHVVKNLNSDFREKLQLTKDLKKMSGSIERILIPVNLDYVRMYSGLPIFVDWKHPAFRYDQIIDWKNRMDLASIFYNSKSLDEQIDSLKKIQKIENNSHIIIKKNNLFVDCEDLIDHDIFMLININNCYGNYF